MTHSVFSISLRRTLVAAAACAVCAGAQAQTDLVETIVSVGAGAASGSRGQQAWFGQYSNFGAGRSAVGLLGLDYTLRKEEQSAWVQLMGSDLLGDTRDLSLVWKNPGSWKITADYGELVHYDPYTINTGLLGVGTTTPQVVSLPGGAGTGTDLDLKTKRTKLGIGFSKIISPAWQIELDLKTENKEGARLFGVGMNCPSSIDASCTGGTAANPGWAVLMLPEPIKANHSQVQARMSYSQDKLRFSLGYYASFYRNDYSTLDPVVPASFGTAFAPNIALQTLLSQSLALPPDNQAHQFDMSGSYDITPTTRSTLKVAFGRATQTNDFAGAGLLNAPGPSTGYLGTVTNLGGQVDTKLFKLGLSSRPIPRLSLLADVRYEDKDDKTPLAFYNADGTGAFTTNRNLPRRKTGGKLQANWQFNSDYRGTLGADFEAIDRGVFTATSAVSGISALRQKTEETGVYAEVRRRMSHDFSGAIKVSSSRRDGSNWLRPNAGAGVTEVADPATGFLPSALFMATLGDRTRDKVKLSANWQTNDKVTLQFSAENGIDKFSTPGIYGVRRTSMNQFGVDGTYSLSYAWSFNGYLSRGAQTIDQSRYAGYNMAFDNTSTSLGVGFAGKISSPLHVGGSLSYIHDKSVYAQTLNSFASAYNAALLASTGGLPDVVYRQTALKLYGKYDLDKRSSVRVDLVHQRTSLDDWAWGYNNVPYVYTDGTTVLQNPNQSVSFIGVSYVYMLP